LLGTSLSSALVIRDANDSSNAGEILRVPLTNNNDQSYSVSVSMGTPFQEVQMAVSLSQTFLVVATPNNNTTGFFNPSQSSSYVPGNTSAAVIDNSGQTTTANFAGESCQVSSFGYDASVAITPASANDDVHLYPKGCHGVLGFGVNPSPDSPGDKSLADDTLLDYYVPGNATSMIFGLELNWYGDKSQSVLTMGTVDTSAYTGDFTNMVVPSTDASDRPSWSIPIEGITADVGGGVVSVSGSMASIDPYYPTIQLPADAVALIYSPISNAAISSHNANRYTVPCGTNIRLTLVFNGRNFAMDPRDAISNENGTCYGIVEVAPGNLFKIGNPFLRNVYTTFGMTFNNSTGTVFNIAFATKVIRPGSGANSNKPSVFIMLLVSIFISVIVL